MNATNSRLDTSKSSFVNKNQSMNRLNNQQIQIIKGPLNTSNNSSLFSNISSNNLVKNNNSVNNDKKNEKKEETDETTVTTDVILQKTQNKGILQIKIMTYFLFFYL